MGLICKCVHLLALQSIIIISSEVCMKVWCIRVCVCVFQIETPSPALQLGLFGRNALHNSVPWSSPKFAATPGNKSSATACPTAGAQSIPKGPSPVATATPRTSSPRPMSGSPSDVHGQIHVMRAHCSAPAKEGHTSTQTCRNAPIV